MAAKKEWSLAFQIGAKLKSNYPAAFKNAEKHMAALNKAASNTGKAWNNFTKKTLSTAKWAAGIGAATTAVAFKLADSAAIYGDALENTAKQLGMTTDGLQAYQYAAQKAGMDTKTFDGAVQNYRASLARMAATPDAGKPLAEFGLSAKKLYAMQPEKAFMRVADYMNKMSDPAKKAKLAATLFGQTAGPKMAALMAQGSKGMEAALEEAKKLGLIMDEESIRQSKSFVLAKQQMTGAMVSLKNTVGVQVMPYFTEAFELSRDAIIANIPAVKEFVSTALDRLKASLPVLKEWGLAVLGMARQVWGMVTRVKDMVGGWERAAKIGVIIYGMITAWRLAVVAINAMKAAYVAMKMVHAVVVGWKIKDKAETIALKALYAKDAIVRGIVTAKTWAFVAAQKVATAAQWLFNAAMSANPIGLIIAAVVALAAGFVVLYKKCEGFRNIVNAMGKSVVDVFVWIYDSVSSVLKGLVDGIMAMVTSAGVIVAKIPKFFSEAFSGALKTGVDFVNNILNKFKPLTDFFGKIGDKVSKIFGGKKTMQVEVAATQAAASNTALPGHADGGIYTRPHIASFAENAPSVPEAAIPVENTPQSYSLWKKVGEMAGFVSPQGTSMPVTSKSVESNEVSMNNSVGSPIQITVSVPITINGNATGETAKTLEKTQQDLASTIKKAVVSALAEEKRKGGRLSYA